MRWAHIAGLHGHRPQLHQRQPGEGAQPATGLRAERRHTCRTYPAAQTLCTPPHRSPPATLIPHATLAFAATVCAEAQTQAQYIGLREADDRVRRGTRAQHTTTRSRVELKSDESVRAGVGFMAVGSGAKEARPPTRGCSLHLCDRRALNFETHMVINDTTSTSPSFFFLHKAGAVQSGGIGALQ